jgi:polysaccharide deacetylase 2 family uncharacterized protein YibQ
MTTGTQCLLFVALSFFISIPAQAEALTDLPVISIIIDDLGSDNPRHERVVKLDAAITCSFLPQNTATVRLAKLAHQYNKEIMLHLPMESVARNPMGPGGLLLDMTQQEFNGAVEKNLASVPHVTGINNHMGSLLTRHPGHMIWLMNAIRKNGDLFFVDSRTTHESVAMMMATEQGIPSLQRDIFLDHDKSMQAVKSQFLKTIERAKRTGTALAIGHPYTNTLAVLEEMLPKLHSMGVRLVTVSEMIDYKHMRTKTWQASLSRSHQVVKSSKP